MRSVTGGTMICPECSGETSELYRSVNLGGLGTLELTILICRECDWVTVYDFTLVKQYKMSFENKEGIK